MHGYNVAPVPTDFNPRSPCGERLCAACHNAEHPEFQSTLPVWGATIVSQRRGMIGIVFQSTLPVWGATIPVLSALCVRTFQSTLPVWGATGRRAQMDIRKFISIHAPRVGSDTERSGMLLRL